MSSFIYGLGTSVNVLGTVYTIKYGNKEQFPSLEDMDGSTDESAHEIIIDDWSGEDLNNDHTLQNDPKAYIRKCMRHEIIHAFLFESGLSDNTFDCEHWARNEEMVDWFAKQSPKIHKAFSEVGCLE